MQRAIPFIFMRGGTSRGPYFKREDLPEDRETLSKVLVAALGSGHPLNIDGIGGGNAVTTKVAMLSKCNEDWADIDYFFAQVGVENRQVDYGPTCGNILSGVGPAAIEMGLIETREGINKIRIRAVNTGARVLASVLVKDGQVEYQGEVAIDGIPGKGAPIELHFMDVAGSSTGNFLPTGSVRNTINGIEVSCMDVAMPMVIARAKDFGVSGYETTEQLDKNRALFEQIEQVRLKAALMMGMGDCSKSVVPKFGLVSEAKQGGSLNCRYFMPWATHPSLAVTGSQCLAACALTPNSIADRLWQRTDSSPATIQLEHPSGMMDVIVDYELDGDHFRHKSAGIVRTARKLVSGDVFIPA